VSLPDVDEASGLAVSRQYPGVLWSHNDSGNATVLFALDTAGAVRGRVQVPADTRDWEDVSIARCGDHDCVYIADIGDNRLVRPRVYIYRVPEPAPQDPRTDTPTVFRARYADGAHNAEAMFVAGDNFFIVTRDRTGRVYRAQVPASPQHELVFEHVGDLGLAAVTDAETSRDDNTVIVRTSHEAVLYRAADVLQQRFVPYLRVPLDGLKERQGEAVALDGNMIYLASEGPRFSGGGSFVSLRCAFPQ
jgi:hypothetical protein